MPKTTSTRAAALSWAPWTCCNCKPFLVLYILESHVLKSSILPFLMTFPFLCTRNHFNLSESGLFTAGVADYKILVRWWYCTLCHMLHSPTISRSESGSFLKILRKSSFRCLYVGLRTCEWRQERKKQNMLFYLTTILAVNISGNTCICLIKKKKKQIFKYHTKPIILLSTSFIYWK